MTFEANVTTTCELARAGFNAFTIRVTRIGRTRINFLTSRTISDEARFAFAFEGTGTGRFTDGIAVARFAFTRINFVTFTRTHSEARITHALVSARSGVDTCRR